MNIIEQKLIEAQEKAKNLFKIIEERNLICSGKTEKEINTEIYELAFELYGIKKYWHKRIVRAGKNTLFPYRENPPNLLIKQNDIVFLDFGPVFEDWEADFGRTFVLGNDHFMIKLQADIMLAFDEGKKYFNSRSNITGGELYYFVKSLAAKYSWEFGHVHCGHLIGKFPHEKVEDHEVNSYLHPDNKYDLKSVNSNGLKKHWILEIHFVDRQREIGGFTEELLTI